MIDPPAILFVAPAFVSENANRFGIDLALRFDASSLSLRIP
jgi:hypothetical protein